MKAIKIAVTGAAGRVGQAFLFQLLAESPFSNDTVLELRLLETPEKASQLNGICMELEDCASPYLSRVIGTSDCKEAFQEVDWAILIGAFPRRAGMERRDLLAMNGKIFSEQGRAINDYAAHSVRVLVVGNPCNTNCFITMQHAPDVPRDRFYAMTLLDELRAKAQLSLRARVAVDDVQGMHVWGNHSSTLYPDFYQATIQGRSAMEVIQDEHWLQNEFIRTVQTRGAEILKAQGVPSAASAAYATRQTLHDLIHGVEAGCFFTVAKPSEGEYGIDEGLIFSFPCFLKQGRLHVAEGIQHGSFAHQKIQESLNELREERKLLGTRVE